MTDFPTVYVERPFAKVIGRTLAGACSRVCYAYAGALYRRFDAVFVLSENGGAAKLRSRGVPKVDIVPLGVELGEFGTAPERSGMTPLYNCGHRGGRNPERGKKRRLRGIDIYRARTTINRYAIAEAHPRLEPAFRVTHDTTVKEIRRHALHKEEFFNLF